MTPPTTNRTIAISISCTLVDGKVVFVLVNKDDVDVDITVKKSADNGASYSGFAISLVLAAGNSTTVIDDNVTPNQTYLYKTECTVASTTQAAFAGSVNEFVINTAAKNIVDKEVGAKVAPTARLLDIASISYAYNEAENVVAITWQQLAGMAGQRYVVTRYLNDDQGGRVEDIETVVTQNQFNDTDLQNGQVIQYSVVAVDAAGNLLSEPCETEPLKIEAGVVNSSQPLAHDAFAWNHDGATTKNNDSKAALCWAAIGCIVVIGSICWAKNEPREGDNLPPTENIIAVKDSVGGANVTSVSELNNIPNDSLNVEIRNPKTIRVFWNMRSEPALFTVKISRRFGALTAVMANHIKGEEYTDMNAPGQGEVQYTAYVQNGSKIVDTLYSRVVELKGGIVTPTPIPHPISTATPQVSAANVDTKPVKDPKPQSSQTAVTQTTPLAQRPATAVNNKILPQPKPDNKEESPNIVSITQSPKFKRMQFLRKVDAVLENRQIADDIDKKLTNKKMRLDNQIENERKILYEYIKKEKEYADGCACYTEAEKEEMKKRQIMAMDKFDRKERDLLRKFRRQRDDPEN